MGMPAWIASCPVSQSRSTDTRAPTYGSFWALGSGRSMKIEDISDDVLSLVVLGKINAEFEFLAFKLILVRLRTRVATNFSAVSFKESVAELRAFFEKHDRLPSAMRDLDRIQAKGAEHDRRNV